MSEDLVKREFDKWAVNGSAEDMEQGHRDMTDQALERVSLTKDDVCLDVGCGNGWAARLMKELGAGEVVGIDISGEMIRRARENNDGLEYHVAGAENLPFPDGRFSFILNVESLYYYENVDTALAEIRRVCAPGARFLCIVDLFKDNPGSVNWQKAFDFKTHLLSEAEYKNKFERAGFTNVETVRIIGREPITPESEFESSIWFPTYNDYKTYREIGSLLIDAKV